VWCRDAERHAQRPGSEQCEPPGRWSVMLGSTTLLNDLVRAEQYRLRDRKAERFGCLEVDH
jgi:hypothetical protein